MAAIPDIEINVSVRSEFEDLWVAAFCLFASWNGMTPDCFSEDAWDEFQRVMNRKNDMIRELLDDAKKARS